MELVILVDEKNNVVGTAPKDQIHTTTTPLHRGFSVFLFNAKNELLLTRRALSKKTFPGVWTNTTCGHPAPGETAVSAAWRRLKDELGLDVDDIREVAPYRYRFADVNGIVENEVCPILVAYSGKDPKPKTEEVAEWKWMKWEEFLTDIQTNNTSYSPWSIEEANLLRIAKIPSR